MEANQDIQKTSSIADNVPPSGVANATEPALPKDPLVETTSSDHALPEPGPSAELLALTTSDCAVLRGYFKENTTEEKEDEDEDEEDENPKRPIIEADNEGSKNPIRMHLASEWKNFEYRFKTTDIERGVYYAVWSLSFAHIDIDTLSDLRFSVEIFEGEENDYGKLAAIDLTTKELKRITHSAKIQKENIVRLKVPIQAIVDSSITKVEVGVALNFRTEGLTPTQIEEMFLEFHNVELHPDTTSAAPVVADPEIILLKDTAIQQLNVCHADTDEKADQPPKPVLITAVQTSASGSHVATMSFTKTKVHIDLWKINDTLTPDPNVNEVPCATMSLPIKRNSKGETPPLEMALSYDASKIAIFPSANIDKEEFPTVPQFQVFQYSTLFTPVLLQQDLMKDSSIIQAPESGTLIPLATFSPDDLLRFQGYGRFHYFNKSKISESDVSTSSSESADVVSQRRHAKELFITCDGRRVTVYNTSKRWFEMHHIQLTLPSDLELPPPKKEKTKGKDKDKSKNKKSKEELKEEEEAAQKEQEELKEYLASTLKFVAESAKLLIQSIEGRLCAWRSRLTLVLDLQTATVVSQYMHDYYENWFTISPDQTTIAFGFGYYNVVTYMIYGQTMLSQTEPKERTVRGTFLDKGGQLLIQYGGARNPFLLDPCNPTAIQRKLKMLLPRDGIILALEKDMEDSTVNEDEETQIPANDTNKDANTEKPVDDKNKNDEPPSPAYDNRDGIENGTSNDDHLANSNSDTITEDSNGAGKESNKDPAKPLENSNETNDNEADEDTAPGPPPKLRTDLAIAAFGSRLAVYSVRKSTFTMQGDFDNGAYREIHEVCTKACREGQNSLVNPPKECTTEKGLKFKLELVACRSPFISDFPYKDDSAEDKAVELTVFDSGRKRTVQKISHYRNGGNQYNAYFLPCNTRYVVEGQYYFQVWKLPTDFDDSYCELLLMKSLTLGDLTSEFPWYLKAAPMKVCAHGKTIYTDDSVIELADEALLSREHAKICFNSIPIICSLYHVITSIHHRRALLQYVLRFINSYPDPENPAYNVISRIVDCRKIEDYAGYDYFLKNLLAFNEPKPTWHPKAPYSEGTNPIQPLLDTGKTYAKDISVAKILVDYCARMAKSKRDIAFLWFAIDCLPEMCESHPELAVDVMRGTAFVPVNDTLRRSFVDQALVRPSFVDQALIRPSPTISSAWDLISSSFSWKSTAPKIPVSKYAQPVFQVQVLPTAMNIYSSSNVSENDGFTMDVFVVPFKLLWKIRLAEGEIPKVEAPPTFWRSLYVMLLWKTKPKAFQHIETHKFKQEFFDNPAIAGLLEYKWNTFANYYWKTRLFFQCIYYLLVLAVTLLQIYDPSNKGTGVFVAIVAYASVFLWLEFIECMKSLSEYLRSPYNYIDLVVYLLPLAASVVQLWESDTIYGIANERLFSFSILVIYLHILFELRAIKSVCTIVTIILSITRKIRVFFIIFAASIFAFTHAFLHLLWAGSIESRQQLLNEQNNDTSSLVYPQNFGKALSATYFFMGGRYDPIASMFTSGDGAFHIMMVIYFFFTVILMLNVLIALINAAYTAADESWRPVWLENRLYYVANAENMTFQIPGFRGTHDWFPSEIYYTATTKTVKEFNDKYFKNVATAASIDNATATVVGGATGVKEPEFVSMVDKTASTTIATNATTGRTEEIEHRLDTMQQEVQTNFKEMQDHLKMVADLLRQQQK